MDISEVEQRTLDILHDLTDLPIEIEQGSDVFDCRPDFVIRVGPATFLCEYKSRATAESIGAALKSLESCPSGEDAHPLLIVPFMGDVGRAMCERAEMEWLDLSGNALIRARGLHVFVSGKPNQFSTRGRSPDLFAPKASRIPRVMLASPARSWRHQELVMATDLSKGYVSKLLARLVEGGFVRREDSRYSLDDPPRLLDTWHEAYDFSQHRLMRGVFASRTPHELFVRLLAGLAEKSVEHAATGLAAAWFYTRFASYRLVTSYVSRLPNEEERREMGFRPVETGANVWLVEPSDTSVFWNAIAEEGITYVSPLQAYLDLKAQPERSSEAAESLRERVLQDLA